MGRPRQIDFLVNKHKSTEQIAELVCAELPKLGCDGWRVDQRSDSLVRAILCGPDGMVATLREVDEATFVVSGVDPIDERGVNYSVWGTARIKLRRLRHPQHIAKEFVGKFLVHYEKDYRAGLELVQLANEQYAAERALVVAATRDERVTGATAHIQIDGADARAVGVTLTGTAGGAAAQSLSDVLWLGNIMSLGGHGGPVLAMDDKDAALLAKLLRDYEDYCGSGERVANHERVQAILSKIQNSLNHHKEMDNAFHRLADAAQRRTCREAQVRSPGDDPVGPG